MHSHTDRLYFLIVCPPSLLVNHVASHLFAASVSSTTTTTAAGVATQEDDNDELEESRNELARLEQKLHALTEQKHAKFQLLKGILVEEAKSKMTAVSDAGTTGTPASK